MVDRQVRRANEEGICHLLENGSCWKFRVSRSLTHFLMARTERAIARMVTATTTMRPRIAPTADPVSDARRHYSQQAQLVSESTGSAYWHAACTVTSMLALH